MTIAILGFHLVLIVGFPLACVLVLFQDDVRANAFLNHGLE